MNTLQEYNHAELPRIQQMKAEEKEILLGLVQDLDENDPDVISAITERLVERIQAGEGARMAKELAYRERLLSLQNEITMNETLNTINNF